MGSTEWGAFEWGAGEWGAAPSEAEVSVATRDALPYAVYAGAASQDELPWESSSPTVLLVIRDALPFDASGLLSTADALPFDALGALATRDALPFEILEGVSTRDELPWAGYAGLLTRDELPWESFGLAMLVTRDGLPWMAFETVEAPFTLPFEVDGQDPATLMILWRVTAKLDPFTSSLPIQWRVVPSPVLGGLRIEWRVRRGLAALPIRWRVLPNARAPFELPVQQPASEATVTVP